MHNSAIYGLILLKFCMDVAHVSGPKLYLAAFVKKKAKQRLQRPLKSKMHNSAIYGPILLKFWKQVSSNGSHLKLDLSAFWKKGLTKAAKAFNVQISWPCRL